MGYNTLQHGVSSGVQSPWGIVKFYDITMSAIVGALQVLRFLRVPMLAECPNVTLESKTMAGENILLKTTEKASFYPSLLSLSLP